jgi:hypothetical protein
MIWIIITFIVLYSIIKSCNSFFVINRHIARQDFILNDLFSGGRNPGKILKCTSQTFSTSFAMTSHKHKPKVAQKFYKRRQIYTHRISNIYRLIHGLFHIAFIISSRPRDDISRGLMTRTIWKRPCINLFITYFARADNMLMAA